MTNKWKIKEKSKEETTGLKKNKNKENTWENTSGEVDLLPSVKPEWWLASWVCNNGQAPKDHKKYKTKRVTCSKKKLKAQTATIGDL